MNLRKATDSYMIGINMTPANIGWAVTDDDGNLFHFKGKPTWGTRHFGTPETAAKTRLHRSARRTYARRQQRIARLQELFADSMESVDPTFFIRLNQSSLLTVDKDDAIKGFRWPLFNDKDFDEADYYKRFPTIYHLRRHLMSSDEPADLRLVYLAMHHIMRHRGNFHHDSEGSSLSAKNSNASLAAEELVDQLRVYLEEVVESGYLAECDVDAVAEVLEGKVASPKARVLRLTEAFGAKNSDAKARCKVVARAVLGYKVEYATLFESLVPSDDTKVSLSDEESADTFEEQVCPDDGLALYQAIRFAYSSFVLSHILRGAESISDAMVMSYDRHHEDLQAIKRVFRKYAPEEYDWFFRGEKDGKDSYDINALQKGTYTSYISGESKANGLGTSHKELIDSILEVIERHPAIKEDEEFQPIMTRLEDKAECDVLLKQRNKANRVIPYQLHLEELDAIIERQGRHHPFLIEHRDELRALVSKRIPYYVGPLNAGHDPLGHYDSNPVDPTRKFAWSVRLPGKEHAAAYPWNVDEVIDLEATAERFIRRLTDKCTYLLDAPVIPSHSLLYEEYLVRNELNSLKWCRRGETPRRLDAETANEIYEDLFKHRRSANVSYDLVRKWLLNERGAVEAEVYGNQGADGFTAKLVTYHDFCKILDVRDLDDSTLSYDEVEEIVGWNTVFSDRNILRRKISEKYGPRGNGKLSTSQIKKIVNKRYQGWGKLSREFLTELTVPALVPGGSVSIMDVLRDGNPRGRRRMMVLMEIINDKKLGFKEAIEEANREYLDSFGGMLSIDDMVASPAVKGMVKQSFRIIDEIVGITGKLPAKICIQTPREERWQKKSVIARKRYNRVKTALQDYHADPEILKELEDHKGELHDDRKLLYFEQAGRCMYSGDHLDLSQISSYEIDYIIPRAYIADTSQANRVLVKTSCNLRKADDLLLDDDIIKARNTWWRTLLRAGLLSERKYERLTRNTMSDDHLTGLLNRQLVEQSQAVKIVRQLCEQRYPGVEVFGVKEAIVRDVRWNVDRLACRELNSYHYAHDAFLVCQVATFVDRCLPHLKDGMKTAIMKRYVTRMSGNYAARIFGDTQFIAGSMTRLMHRDQTTDEVIWDNDERNDRIKRCLAYRTCFTSEKPVFQTGAFWNATIYSPKDKRIHQMTPRDPRNTKGYVDPARYGVISMVRQAYYLIFVASDRNGNDKFFFEGVPIYLADEVGPALQEFAEDIATRQGCSNVRILRTGIPLCQRLELNGFTYLLGGKSGKYNTLNPTYQMWADHETTSQVRRVMRGDDSLTDTELVSLYDWVCVQARRSSDLLAGNLRLEERRPLFVELETVNKVDQLAQLIRRLDGSYQTVNIRALGGKQNAGNLKRSISDTLQDITWVFPSITGMYENRITFDDLIRNAE